MLWLELPGHCCHLQGHRLLDGIIGWCMALLDGVLDVQVNGTTRWRLGEAGRKKDGGTTLFPLQPHEHSLPGGLASSRQHRYSFNSGGINWLDAGGGSSTGFSGN